MATQKELITFIKEMKDILKIRIDHLSWPQKYNIKLYDIQTSFVINGKEFSGRGTDPNSNSAVQKSFSEAIERYAMDYYGHATTNGMAIHPLKKIAAELAESEVIERDAFLCHFLTRTPMIHLQIKESTPTSNSITSLLEKNNIKIHTLKMSSSSNSICVILDGTKALTNKFGFIVGASRKKLLPAAIQNAMIECIRDYISIQENGVRDISLEKFNEIKNPTASDHLLLARNIQYSEKISSSLLPSQDIFQVIINEEIPFIIKNEFLQIPDPFSSLTLYLSQASSSDMQNLFFGNTTRFNLNSKRLENFASRPIDLNINQPPHPFG